LFFKPSSATPGNGILRGSGARRKPGNRERLSIHNENLTIIKQT